MGRWVVMMVVLDCGFECLDGGVSESDMVMLGKRNRVREKKRVEGDGGEGRGEERKQNRVAMERVWQRNF